MFNLFSNLRRDRGGTRSPDALHGYLKLKTRPEASFHQVSGAFTLLELLTVIAIIAILVSLGFGAARRASESGRSARARAELTLLAAALESYRHDMGDFPRTSDPAMMLQALIGKRGPLSAVVSTRGYVDLGSFTIGDGRDPFTDATSALVDPWGFPYRYAYQTITPWRNPRFILYSVGPDGRDDGALLSGGFPDPSIPENSDNLYADRL